MGQKIRDIKRVEVATSAGSTATAHTIATTNNTSIRVRVELLGRRAFNADTYCRIEEIVFKNVAGTVSQVGAASTVFFVSDTDINLSTLNFSISGTDIEVSVTGDPDTNVLTIFWELILYIDVN